MSTVPVMGCFILRRRELKKIKRKYGLRNKMLLSIAILCLCICAASCTIGYIQYDNTIKKLYNENGYTVANLALKQINHNKIGEYVEKWEEDSYYPVLKQALDNVVEISNVKYIYIAIPNEDGTIRYVYDSSGKGIGETDPVTKYLGEALEIYRSGEPIRNNYFVRKSKKYGSLTSSILPIKDNKGNTVALLFVDVAMEIIRSTLAKFIIRSLVISILLMIIFIKICWMSMDKAVLSPISTIEKSLFDFANNSTELSEDLKQINTNDELQTLSETIYSMEESILKYIEQVTKITAEKERIGAELNVAHQIQADMLPNIFPPFPEKSEFDIYAKMTPAKEVGGDFYDFFMIDDSHVGIVMADVSGKGIPAALFMVISKTLLKNRAQMKEGEFFPSEVLATVNNQLCKNNKAEMFVTVWLGILDINTGIIKAANAGHEYPVIKHNGKYELFKDKHGFVLAGMENLKYKDYEIKLDKGDALFIYTDGVTEATNINNDLFGTERMVDALNLNANGSCLDILLNVQQSIDDFVLDAPQFDDITMLCLAYYGV